MIKRPSRIEYAEHSARLMAKTDSRRVVRPSFIGEKVGGACLSQEPIALASGFRRACRLSVGDRRDREGHARQDEDAHTRILSTDASHAEEHPQLGSAYAGHVAIFSPKFAVRNGRQHKSCCFRKPPLVGPGLSSQMQVLGHLEVKSGATGFEVEGRNQGFERQSAKREGQAL